jgi:hypothetical protein
MTDTDTTTTTELRPDVLTLVTVSEDYYRRGMASTGMAAREDERTFFATPHREPDGRTTGGYVTLIVPTTDSRSSGMWEVEERYASLFDDGGLTRSDYRGWALATEYVTPLLPGDDDRPLEVGERVKISDTHPAGEPWAGHTGTVRAAANPSGHVSVETDEGRQGGFRPEYLTRVAGSDDNDRPLAVGDRVRVSDDEGSAWAGVVGTIVRDNGPWLIVKAEESTSPHVTIGAEGGFDKDGSTLTRIAPQEPVEAPETAREAVPAEEVDRLIREAVAAAKQEADEALEEFKETANARAVQYARDNALCSEFERCMSDIVLLGRDEWDEAHSTEYVVTMTVRVEVTATDEENAREKAWSVLYNDLSYPIDHTIEHHDIREA